MIDFWKYFIVTLLILATLIMILIILYADYKENNNNNSKGAVSCFTVDRIQKLYYINPKKWDFYTDYCYYTLNNGKQITLNFYNKEFKKYHDFLKEKASEDKVIHTNKNDALILNDIAEDIKISNEKRRQEDNFLTSETQEIINNIKVGL